MHKSIAVLLFLALASCGGVIEVTSPFDAKAASLIDLRGSATISGQAFMRQRGGGIVTCAGNEVALVPAVAYTKEFVTKSFGSSRGGVIPAIMAPSVEHPSDWNKYRRIARCDADGDFVFPSVPNGEFYLFTILLWEVPGSIVPEGGAMAEYVVVAGGRDARVLMTQ